jgi:hypothetical protein
MCDRCHGSKPGVHGCRTKNRSGMRLIYHVRGARTAGDESCMPVLIAERKNMSEQNRTLYGIYSTGI